MASIARLSITALVLIFTIKSAGDAAADDAKLIGYINSEGTVVIEPAFITARDFSEGLAGAVPKGSELFGIIDETGTMIVSPRFRDIGLFANGLAPAVDKLGRSGFVDKKGAFVIPPQYDNAFEFREGLARVTMRDRRGENAVYKQGFIDASGKSVISPQFDLAYDFSEGFARVMLDKKWNFVDKTGKILMAEWLDGADDFSDDQAPILKDGLWGFVNKKGVIAIAAHFSCTCPFNNGHAMVGLNKGQVFRIIDTNGRFSTDRTFPSMGQFQEGVTFVYDEDKRLQCIDTQGRTVIGPEKLAGIADYFTKFHEGLARVCINGRYGYINKTGEVVIKPRPTFVQAGDFSSGRARIAAGQDAIWVERGLPNGEKMISYR